MIQRVTSCHVVSCRASRSSFLREAPHTARTGLRVAQHGLSYSHSNVARARCPKCLSTPRARFGGKKEMRDTGMIEPRA